MILCYFLRTFCLIICHLLSGACSDFLTHQTMRFFHPVRNDFLIYGITQDCQLYFVEHMNYMLIKSLKVDRSNTYCYPNLVKLHLRQGIKQISLMLIIKQAMNCICTLPIEIPSLETVSNGQVFSYSIFTSLPYAACSHLRDNSFILEPDLSFMDTTFSDIIYFINAKSVGSQWNIQQFWINNHGNLVAMEKFVVYRSQKGNGESTGQFNQFIVELDLKRSILYTFNRLRRNLLSECLFDLLFRSSHLLPKWIKFDKTYRTQAWLESFAVDDQLMMFTESIRNEVGATSELYLTNLRIRNSSTRLLHLDFVGDIGVLRKQTYADLSTRNVPTFGDMRQLYAQNVQNTQLAMSQASPKHTIFNTISPTILSLTVETTLTSTTASSGKTTTINGIDRFYSEIENDHSSGIIDHGIEEETKTLTTARPTTQSAQFTKDVRSNMKELEKEERVGNMEEIGDTFLPNSTDSEIFWKNSIPEVDKSEGNTMLNIDDHIYNKEVGLIADHSEVTLAPNTTLRSNCTLIMMQLNIFICLLASFHERKNDHGASNDECSSNE
uniref:Uncharacterized protein n=1 Tax=Wuchereria bancrofti TaxID=6293 RepID=A0A1I8EDN1_WUCBA